ncbi:unnamed protein product [Euphydryas editha]|nr:unnamed protein product [Euphydryas editha]
MKNRKYYGSKTKSILKSEKEIQIYNETLKENLEHFTTWEQNNSVQEINDKIVSAIDTSLKKAQNSLKTKNILSDNTRKLILRRQQLQKLKPKTRSMKNELKALYKLISKLIHYDYTSHRKKTIEKYVLHFGSIKRAYKELRSNKTWIEGLKTSNKTTNNRNEILQVATNYYKNLYKCENQEQALTMQKETSTAIQDIDEAEIIKNISKLKNEKSPGPDGITNEALKVGAPYLARPLTQLFNLVLKSATTPKQWTESDIILLYKKGDPNDINNYRPISLLSSIYKLFSSILERRIRSTIETHQTIEQAGFRRGFSTVDHIHSIELLIDKYQEFHRPLYLAFIDYRKAFDSLYHHSIWQSLQCQNIDSTYLKVLQNLYQKCNSRIRLETTGPPIPIRRGVRQGDVISPTIFIAVLQQVIGQLNWEKVGLNINNRYISHLRFADDIVLLSENTTELQSMINDLHAASLQVGLEMNRSKTNIMTNSIRHPVYVENILLEYVDTYIYLGKQISFHKQRNEHEVDRRITNAWKKFWSLKEVMKSNMPITVKQKVMDTCILPSLTYACQTWKFTHRIKSKIRSCQRSMERSLLKVKKIQKIRHVNIRKITKVMDALYHCKKLKWRWAGHIARLTDNRWTHTITLWKGPPGTRKRGKPVARWADDIIKVAGKKWMETATNKETWKSLEEAFTFENEGFLLK